MLVVVVAAVLATSSVPLAGAHPAVAADPAVAATSPAPPRFLGAKATPRLTRVSTAKATVQAVGDPPPGLQDTIAIGGLTAPTNVRFASDGRVFVAEKSGLILVYPSLASTTPTVFADLQTNVDDFWDRGLLGLALDPNFPTSPYVYALYTFDAAIGGTAPRWNDACPANPGATTDGCVVSGRLSRFTVSGNVASGEQVLIEDWCQQYPSHSIGDLSFGPDGALYVSGGDGASFTFQDYGQGGGGGITAQNPCGDPPEGFDGFMTAPTARGGRLRSQSLRRPAGEPVALGGALLRVDPATGAGLPTNPLASNLDQNAQRIVGYGMRNPFRFTFRPGTNEVWLGDVGDQSWEEINRIVDPLAPTVANLGWPCFEGVGQHGPYIAQGLDMCASLTPSSPGLLAPYYTYNHNVQVVPDEPCGTGSSVTSGIAFYSGSDYPATYANALFFADHSRNCIWAMKAGANGLPDPSQIETFLVGAANPVDLEAGPNGDLFYVDHEGGAIHRISSTVSSHGPTAVIGATPTTGLAPLLVSFDGTSSNGAGLSYAWDLDGDGAYDDSTAPAPTFTYTTEGTRSVGLQVTDSESLTSTASTTITVYASLPVPVIDTPDATTVWAVGDRIGFAGHATDATGAAIPAAGLSWTLILHHCPSNCHTHTVQSWTGTAGTSFDAPDHDYPSYLELVLTATDGAGRSASTSVNLNPRTVSLTFVSSPPGLALAVGVDPPVAAPFSKTFIVNSLVGVAAPSPQVLGSTTHTFESWSDGGLASHTTVAPAAAATYAATFAAVPVPPPPATTAPLNHFVDGSSLASGKPDVRFDWTSGVASSGVDHYELALSTDGGPFATVAASLTSATLTRALAAGHTYRAMVRAIGTSGGVGDWTSGASFKVTAFQESSASIHRSGTWRIGTSASYWGARDRYTTSAGAKATLIFIGRSFVWVGSVGPTRGTAKVYVDGVLVKTVDLHAAASANQRVLFTASWSTAKRRTVAIRISGTSGHPRGDVDAMIIGS